MVDRLFGFFPKGAASDAEVFLTGVVQVFAAYPSWAVESVLSPLSGLPAKHTFMPSIAEIKAALDEKVEPHFRSQDRARIYDRSLLLEAPQPQVHETVEQLKEKYGENFGLKTRPKRKWRGLSQRELMVAGGLNEEQWDALPDLPNPEGWK